MLKQNNVLAMSLFACFLIHSATQANEAPTQTVIVTGVGKTIENAKKNAFLSAVEQVVGAMVDAETIIKNEQIVNDQIYSFSGGYVETSEQIGEPIKSEDGLFKIKLKTVVKRTQLYDKLRSTKVISSSLDGGSLFAESLTKSISKENGAILLSTALKDITINLLKASVFEKEIIQDGDPTTIRLTVDISNNMTDYYEKVMPRLRDVLDKTAIRKSETHENWPCEMANSGATEPNSIVSTNQFPDYPWPHDIDFNKEFIIYLNVGRNDDGSSLRMMKYVLPNDKYKAVINNELIQAPILRISFLDKLGKTISQNVFILSNRNSAANFPFVLGKMTGCGYQTDNLNILVINPALFKTTHKCNSNGSFSMCTREHNRFQGDTEILLSKLDAITKISCTFVSYSQK